MKKNLGARILSLLLTLVLLLQSAPMRVFAAGENAFCLVAEAGGRLVIAPEYVAYEEGQTIRQALAASGHTFTGMDDSSGMIDAIDGVSGNFTRSDENGGYNLDAPASGIRFFRFSEAEDSKPSEALTGLMTEMADYLEESADVQAAAKTQYDKAVAAFVGADDAEAAELAAAIADAITAYENTQSATPCNVTFSDGTNTYDAVNYSGVTITAVNAYGKSFTDDGDGVLQLAAGTYDFTVSWNGCHIQGKISVSADLAVSAAMPTGDWLVTDSFQLAGSYGEDFDGSVFSMTKQDGRSFLAVVPDSFTGTVYSYAEYNASELQATPSLTAVYTNAKGAAAEAALAFQSRQSGATEVLKQGAAGNRVVYRIGSVDANGYTVSQDYTVEFARTPSLKAISVKDQDGAAQAATESFNSLVNAYTYKVVDTVTAVTVLPTAFDSSYAVTVNGTAVTGDGVSVPLEQNGEDTVITVQVSAGGYENTYTLTIRPGEGKQITFVTTASDVDVVVVNSNGEALPYTKYKGTDSYNRYVYTLVPGETYSYLATKDDCYHASASFTMEEDADSTITVDVKTEDLLSELALGGQSTAAKKGTIALDSAFAANDHFYTAQISDSTATVSLWATAADGVDAELAAIYDQVSVSALYDGVCRTVNVTSGNARGVVLTRTLIARNPYGNEITVRASQQVGGINYYQDYTVELVRQLSLEDLTAQCNGSSVLLLHADSEETGYAVDVTDYILNVPAAATELVLTAAAYPGSASNLRYGDEETGYRVAVDGEDVTGREEVVVPLSGEQDTEEITVTLTNDHCPELKTEYILAVQKDAPIYAEVTLDPAAVLLTMYENKSGNRVWPENGAYMLSEGYTYTYTATAYGYVGKSGEIEVTRDEDGALVLLMGEETIPVDAGEDGLSGTASLAMTLEQAEENTSINESVTSEWSDFRGSGDNNGITDAAIPFSADEGTLYWANKLGDGYGSDAVGCPIIVDGDLITYSGSTIYRVDTVSGEIIATGTMDHNSSYSITTPTYYEGMIFIALSEGTVQAFNAETLQSLWIYRDPLGGQPNSPITVKDGHLYTGFWVGETSNANYVCLTVTDEDPNTGTEEKHASWYYTHKGGFYWAGAYVGEEFLLVGTDDGRNGYTSQTSQLLLIDRKTGYVMDRWEGLDADIRSTVSYDAATNAYYFTSKGGQFYAVQVVQNGDGWSLTGKWTVELANGSSSTPMSTSTPVVYNGRAYVGVSGIGQFADYSGHNITVIDLSKRSVAYRAETQGYPQTSGLLTTAYEAETGYVYIYFFDNATPGKLRVLRDKPGQTSVDYGTLEEGVNTPYVVFTPYGDQAQYAICSPIVDSYGTVYFKNDSANLMAFGSRIEKIEVTTAPDKTTYRPGETFDPAGMVVTATYANGKTRDVTRYVTFPEEALTEGETTVTLTFLHVMYHNQDEEGGSSTAGITTTRPTADVQITVKESETLLGDVNLDGVVNSSDTNLLFRYVQNYAELDAQQLNNADVNNDGTVNSSDTNLLFRYVQGYVSTL